MESRFCTYKRVGYLRERVAYELGIEFTGVIYASPGVLKHIIKRHGRQFDKRTRTGILAGWCWGCKGVKKSWN